MKYKITIAEVKEIEGKDYPKTDTIYEQTIETAYENVVVDIIRATNQLGEN